MPHYHTRNLERGDSKICSVGHWYFWFFAAIILCIGFDSLCLLPYGYNVTSSTSLSIISPNNEERIGKSTASDRSHYIFF